MQNGTVRRLCVIPSYTIAIAHHTLTQCIATVSTAYTHCGRMGSDFLRFFDPKGSEHLVEAAAGSYNEKGRAIQFHPVRPRPSRKGSTECLAIMIASMIVVSSCF